MMGGGGGGGGGGGVRELKEKTQKNMYIFIIQENQRVIIAISGFLHVYKSLNEQNT